MKKLLLLMMIAISLTVLSSCMGAIGAMGEQIKEEQNKPAKWEFEVVSIKDVNSYEKLGMFGTITKTAPAGKIYKEIVVTVKNKLDKAQVLDASTDEIRLFTKKGAVGIEEEINGDLTNYCNLGAGESTNVTFRFEVPAGTKLTTGAYIQCEPYLDLKIITFPVSE